MYEDQTDELLYICSELRLEYEAPFEQFHTDEVLLPAAAKNEPQRRKEHKVFLNFFLASFASWR